MERARATETEERVRVAEKRQKTPFAKKCKGEHYAALTLNSSPHQNRASASRSRGDERGNNNPRVTQRRSRSQTIRLQQPCDRLSLTYFRFFYWLHLTTFTMREDVYRYYIYELYMLISTQSECIAIRYVVLSKETIQYNVFNIYDSEWVCHHKIVNITIITYMSS